MPSLPLPLALYRLPSPSASSSYLLNCFAEQAPKDGSKQPVILRRGCGIRAWGGVASDVISVRGMHVMADVLYAVIGTNLYSVSSSGVATDIGDVPGGERVSMADNGEDLAIVRKNGDGYHYDGATTVQITDPTYVGFGGGVDVGMLDGFFLFRIPNSNQVFNSGLNAVTFDGLDIFTAEGASGATNGMIIDNREIILTKALTSERWYDAANEEGSPFSRTPDGLTQLGCAAGDSLAQQDNSVFWLANDLTFRRMASPFPVKVSQYGIDSTVQRMAQVSDGFGFSYAQDGHLFVCFTFPFAGRTLVFDVSTSEWHERESYGLGRWRPNCAVNAYGMQLVGDSISGKIGILDPDLFTEWGDPQVCEWQYQSIYAARKRVSLRRFELVANPGDAPLFGQGSGGCLATLKLSEDGGKTFVAQPVRSLGATGQYKEESVWTNLGTAKDWVCRLQLTDPTPLFTTDTVVDVELHGY